MQIRDIRTLPLYQIIAAPLIAMIQADAQAAQTSLEYIERVGFFEEKNGVKKLRMASFIYEKVDESGTVSKFQAKIPVLSLVPIPLLNIKSAKIELSAKIVDVKTEEARTSMNPTEKSEKYYQGWLQPYRTEFRATIASKVRDKPTEKYDMDISITVEESDIPLGISKIFHIMDQAIHEEKE